MREDQKIGSLGSVFTALIAIVMVALYMYLPLPEHVLWGVFLALVSSFMYGATWKDVVPLIVNAAFGLFCGWFTFQLAGLLTPAVGFVPALALASGVGTVVLQFVTMGLLAGSTWGRCPTAFSGMVCCFALNCENLAWGGVAMAYGVVCAVVILIACGYAAKLVAGGAHDGQANDNAANES